MQLSTAWARTTGCSRVRCGVMAPAILIIIWVAAEATATEGDASALDVAASASTLDPACVKWGCDCQFLSDAYGLPEEPRAWGKSNASFIRERVSSSFNATLAKPCKRCTFCAAARGLTCKQASQAQLLTWCKCDGHLPCTPH